MGCSGSKATNGTATMRMLEYERMAQAEETGLKVQPNSLNCEEWREGLISPRTFYNWFHAGYCSAYIQNPRYMLILDFRDVEEWLEERIATSVHYHQLHLFQPYVSEYSQIVLYDKDGSSVGNIKSSLRKAYLRLRSEGLDPRIVLGGMRALHKHCFISLRERPKTLPFASQVDLMHRSVEDLDEEDEEDTEPELHSLELVHPVVGKVEPERLAISWQPSMILENKLYLGRSDQAADPATIKSLGISHILSTSRVRSGKMKGLVYILVNKTSFSLSTLRLTNSFIAEALENGGRILVHGTDGLDQSAAVVVAALMHYFTASLEDCLWFVENSRTGIDLNAQWISILMKLEEDIFGKNISDQDTLWV